MRANCDDRFNSPIRSLWFLYWTPINEEIYKLGTTRRQLAKRLKHCARVCAHTDVLKTKIKGFPIVFLQGAVLQCRNTHCTQAHTYTGHQLWIFYLLSAASQTKGGNGSLPLTLKQFAESATLTWAHKHIVYSPSPVAQLEKVKEDSKVKMLSNESTVLEILLNYTSNTSKEEKITCNYNSVPILVCKTNDATIYHMMSYFCLIQNFSQSRLTTWSCPWCWNMSACKL